MSTEDLSRVDGVNPEHEGSQEHASRSGGGIWALLAAALLAAIVLVVVLTQCVPRVPDVVGLTEKQAVEKLKNVGYEVGSVSKVEVPGTPAGKVAEQAPPANAIFSRGKSVDLVVALGADVVAVPDVMGNDTPAAELIISGKQLVMKVIGQYSPNIPAGAIISQSPIAGTKVRVGATVVVVVSLGIEPTTEASTTMTPSSGSSSISGGGTGTGSGSTAGWNCTDAYPGASVWSSAGDIYIRLSGGGGTRQLTSGSSWDTNPILSPNAKYVVFMRAPSSSAKVEGIGRVCLTTFESSMLQLPVSRPDTVSTVSYGTPVFAPSATGTSPGSDWLVTPQYMTENQMRTRLLVTNVPMDSTWVSWNIWLGQEVELSRSSEAGCVKVTAAGGGYIRNLNVYNGMYQK